jgi:hypothetical protein
MCAMMKGEASSMTGERMAAAARTKHLVVSSFQCMLAIRQFVVAELEHRTVRNSEALFLLHNELGRHGI